MFTIRRFNELGNMQHSWLNAHYHFSFANYHDPRHMGLGPLRVINDDIVRAGGGFDMHPHQDMEIITYVREGAITHTDSLGNKGRTKAGEVQVMSAGTGIVHAEHNLESEDTKLYQIWVYPRERGIQPRWAQRDFPTHIMDGSNDNRLPILASGLPEHEGHGALAIHADAAIFGGRLEKGKGLKQPLKGGAYLLVSKGRIESNGHTLNAGDGAAIADMPLLELTASEDAELVLIDLPTVQYNVA
jgi:redox-sensitive bicupin YhaK (pirin superfamily)